MSTPFLSLCMIVKNEEERISDCLRSVKGHVDEMIVVDTGSSDRTMELCRSFGAKVYEMEWRNDFSAARNLSINRASGEWILWMDADETLDKNSPLSLQQLLKQQDEDICALELVNFYGQTADPDQAYYMASYRFFRKKTGLRFEQRVHEQLNVAKVLGSLPELNVLPVQLLHYGYLDDVVATKKKSARNLKLLLEEKKKNSHYSPWIDYHIASEYYRQKNFNQAFEQVNEAIVRFLKQGILPPSLVYNLKYHILVVTESFEGAWPGIEKAISLYPDYVDLHYYKGITLYSLKRYEEASAVFEHCLNVGESKRQYLTMKGSGSHLAMYFLGKSYEKLGDTKKATETFNNVLKICPNFFNSAENPFHKDTHSREYRMD